MIGRAIAEGLFTWPSEEPQLLGTRCSECGTVTFPAKASCPRCCATDPEECALPREGTLWSWTVQRFRPKDPYLGPQSFSPFGVGYVELPGACLVESRLTEHDGLTIGMPMRLTLLPFHVGDDGDELITYAFEPVR